MFADLQEYTELTNKKLSDIRDNKTSTLLILRAVMGWTVVSKSGFNADKVKQVPTAYYDAELSAYLYSPTPGSMPVMFNPLSSVSDAFLVLQRVYERGLGWTLVEPVGNYFSAYRRLDDTGESWYADGDTIPLAICKAALVAVGAVDD